MTYRRKTLPKRLETSRTARGGTRCSTPNRYHRAPAMNQGKPRTRPASPAWCGQDSEQIPAIPILSFDSNTLVHNFYAIDRKEYNSITMPQRTYQPLHIHTHSGTRPLAGTVFGSTVTPVAPASSTKAVSRRVKTAKQAHFSFLLHRLGMPASDVT